MTTPWVPLLGDVASPDTVGSLEQEVAARTAADILLQAAISAIPAAPVNSVFGRVGAVVKQAGDYNFSDLGGIPNTIGGYGITDFNSLGDARWLQLIGGTLTGPVVDSYTDTGIVSSPIPIFSLINYNPSGTSSRSPIAIAGQVTLDGSQDMSNVNSRSASFSATAAILSTRTAPTFGLYGYKALVQKQNTNTLSWMVGANLSTDNRGGVVSNQINYYAFSQILSGATATILAGFYVDLPFTQAGATITTLYGLYIEDATGIPATVGQKWGVFVKGAVPNFFGGSVAAASFSGDGSALTSLGFGHIAGLPTTLAGYGIGDAYTKTLSDARYLRDCPLLASDTFSGVAGTALSTLSTGGQTWVMWNGAWVVDGSNHAKENASVRDAAVVFDSGITDVDLLAGAQVNNVAQQTYGLIVRGVSAGTYLICQQTNAILSIQKMVAGVKTLLTSVACSNASSATYPSAYPRLRVTVLGNVITVKQEYPVGVAITLLSYTLTGADITTFAGGTFVGLYVTATTGTNALILFSSPSLRAYVNTQATLDNRYVQLDALGQTIGGNSPVGQTAIVLNVGTQNNQGNLKCWGSLVLGNNADILNNSTGSGFLHVGSFSGITLGLSNGTVHLKAIAAGISSPVAPFIQTTGGAPALSTSPGVAGQHAWDAGFLYICIAANTWMRAAVVTF